MFGREQSKARVNSLRRVFNKLDNDNDGKIELRELKRMLSDEDRDVELNKDQVDALVKRADHNGDGDLDEEEFAQLVTSEEAQKSDYRRYLYRIADTVIARTERPVVHSYLDEYTACPPPVFVILISLVELCVFFGYYATSRADGDGVLTACAGCFVDSGEIGPLMFAPSVRFQAWRFLTYMFLHQGLLHLIPNLVFQLLVGVPLEVVHKFWRIGPIYLLAVILGALLQYVLDPSVYLVGASAGVYALVLAHLSNVILNWAEMPYKWWRLGAVAAFLILDVSFAVYRRLFANECDRVSYTAHIAGAITGLLMGIVLLHNLQVLKWERILIFVCFGVYALIFILTTILVIFITPFSRPIWETTDCRDESQL